MKDEESDFHTTEIKGVPFEIPYKYDSNSNIHIRLTRVHANLATEIVIMQGPQVKCTFIVNDSEIKGCINVVIPLLKPVVK